jgi:transposase
MRIVGGLDIHRKQLTFDYLDTVTGEVRRGQITPADRGCLRGWLARFTGRDDVAFALEGCMGWRYVAEELAVAGVAAHVAEPADTAFARGRKRHARRTRPARGICGSCWPRAGWRSAGSRRRTSWSAGHCSSCMTTFGPGTPHRRSCAVFFHQGAPALGEAALRTGRDLAAVRESAAAHLPVAGQLQVATALGVLAALEAHLDMLRHQLLQAARHLTGAKVLTERLYAVGRSPRWR